MLRAVLFLLCGLLLIPASAAAMETQAGIYDALIADAKAAMLSDPRQAESKARAAQHAAEAQPSTRSQLVRRATAIWLRGEALLRLNDLANAEPLIARAVDLAARVAPGSHLQGDALLASGWVHSAEGDVAQALTDYQRGHAIFLALGETRSQAKALQSIGSLYADANDYVSALRYYGLALDAYKADPMLAMTLYNNRGNAFKDLRRYRDAEAQFRQALALTQQMDSPLLRVVVLANIAEARLLDGDVAGAEQAIDDGMRLTRRGEGAAYRKFLIGLRAQAAYQRGDLANAATFIGQRFEGEDLGRTTLIDREAHRTAYTIYTATGAHTLALRHLVALKRLDDEATTLARSTGAALMAARFDFANQELKIANLQRDEARRNVAFEQARTRTQRNIFLGVSAAAALIVAMLAFGLVTLRRSRDKVRAANADLAVTNAALGKALAAKTEFLATTSHEIRTPLNGILGMTQVMLADRSIAGATRDRVSVVHSAGVTMRTLVDDILDVAKMETGNLVIEAAPFDLAAMLHDSTRLWDDQARAKGLTFTRDLDDCPGMILGDAVRLRQMVFNLMSNALKFTTSGGVSLSVATTSDARLHVVIADTGVGIASDKCEEIFESFRQADTSTTRQFGGTGLGLSICRNIARAMGGDVTVASTPGVGSRFVVDLPLVRAPERAAQDEREAVAPDLLIIDGSPITRSMLKTLLAPHAGAVALAASLDDALPVLRRGGVTRILVDAAAFSAEGHAAAMARQLVDTGGVERIVILWPAGSDPDRDGIGTGSGYCHVIKPVNGMSLVAFVYPDGDVALVSQAA